MNVLTIALTVTILSTVILQSMLYTVKENSIYFNITFGANFIFSLGMAWVYWLTLPMNWTMQATIAVCYGLLGISAIILKMKNKASLKLCKTMLTLSIIASVLTISL